MSGGDSFFISLIHLSIIKILLDNNMAIYKSKLLQTCIKLTIMSYRRRSAACP
ncbi:hypothetical protein SMITH_188 [Smithella sp. ME-1]|nr:hypothetical protein SMITH_188 [Smithella sp. ME-1]